MISVAPGCAVSGGFGTVVGEASQGPRTTNPRQTHTNRGPRRRVGRFASALLPSRGFVITTVVKSPFFVTPVAEEFFQLAQFKPLLNPKKIWKRKIAVFFGSGKHEGTPGKVVGAVLGSILRRGGGRARQADGGPLCSGRALSDHRPPPAPLLPFLQHVAFAT